MMDVEEKISSLEQRIEKLEEKLTEDEVPVKSSLKEFVAKVSPENHRDRFKAIGYYLENREGKRNFTSGTIQEAYDDLKRSYSNPSTLLRRMYDDNELIKNGEDENGATQWRLHAETEEEIEERIENDS